MSPLKLLWLRVLVGIALWAVFLVVAATAGII